MILERRRNNYVTHKLGLYLTAYLLSRNGFLVDIDKVLSRNGHIKITKGERSDLILSKSLSEMTAVPFTSGEINKIDRFTSMILCVGVYHKRPTFYQLPIEVVKKCVHSNVGNNSRLNYWLEHDEYQIYKMNSADLSLNL